MPEVQTIFFAGGGTGGHLYPGIAVADALRAARPNVKSIFLCTTRVIDKIILEPSGFEFIPQPIVPPSKTISGLLKFWKSWRETRELVSRALAEHHPVAVIGLGGYAAGAAVKGASHAHVPTALINPDVIPGKANQYLMRDVRDVYCQFGQTREYVQASLHHKLKITGCPIRSVVRHLPAREAAAARLSLEPLLRTLVVTGASQGAQTVNEAVLEVLKTTRLQGWQILHLAGREHAEAVRTAYRELQVSARVIDFTPEMADVWAVADLAISRSGASSCAELTACGIPSILFPYPFHKDMHQKLNAKVLAESGAAIMMDDQRDPRKNAEALKPVLESLLFDASKRAAMSSAARSLGQPDAAETIASDITELIVASR